VCSARRFPPPGRSKSADFDPVAERLLAWLIETDPLPEDEPAPHGR